MILNELFKLIKSMYSCTFEYLRRKYLKNEFLNNYLKLLFYHFNIFNVFFVRISY